MTKIGHCMLTLLALLTLGVTARAQDAVSRDTSRAAGPAVTISITERGVRFAALGSFGKMRLEVFNADGTSLHNSDFGAASVRDWALDDKGGQHFPDGTYLCVITIRDLSGRLTTKQGSVVLQGGQPSLKMPDGESVEVVEPDKSLARVTDPPNAALMLTSHDGYNGQVVNTRGALTFRFGDFFGGKDKELMRLTEEGNLGIGTSKPEFKLDVAGAIRAREGVIFNDGSSLNMNDRGALTLTSSNGKGPLTLTNGGATFTPNVAGTGTQDKLAKWIDNSGTLGDSVIAESSGNIGIGTTTPSGSAKVHVKSGDTAGILMLDSGSTTGQFSDIWLADRGIIKWELLKSPDNSAFAIYDSAAATYRAYFKNNGNVGIGTTNPQAALDISGNLNVTGNATISGNIAAKYQDIAEWTSARSELPSGTVVSLDTLKPNSVMASNKPYDTRVAGVVSTQPGVILGEGGPNRVMVATTGRVRVRVDASRYPIHIGDLLVTSNVPGVAMKSQPLRVHGKVMHRPGTIIGKALEPLRSGEGTILVLLSLQ